MKYRYLIFLIALLPVLCGCNDSDDVMKIFTGKTWKLTYITKKNDHKPFDFWENPETTRKAQQYIESTAGAFTVTFQGISKENSVKGTLAGQLKLKNLSGNWYADGESQAFSTSQLSGSEKDEYGIANKFMDGLSKAKSYSGNTDNLYLYYKDDAGRDLCLVFHVAK